MMAEFSGALLRFGRAFRLGNGFAAEAIARARRLLPKAGSSHAPGPGPKEAQRLGRHVPEAALGALLVAALSMSCSPREPRADLVILNGAEPESLDPAIITGQPDMRVVRGLFEGLTRLDPVRAHPVPGLATHWDVSSDPTVYTFHLRTNAFWSTGQPITAKDVVYSWRRALDPQTASDYAGQLYYVKNARAYNTGQIQDPEQVGIRALDDRTVRVELTGPTPFFLDLCALPVVMVVPQFAVAQHEDRWLLAKPIPCSGPYVLESWRIHDKIRLRKNPRYWDASRVYSEVIDFLPIDSPATALNLYETKQADIIWDKNLIPSQLLDVLRGRPDCHTNDYLGTFFYRYNVTRAPFDDVRVRKALALAVDKGRIVDRITRGGEKVASHFTPAGLAQYRPPPGLGYDPEAARRLLSEAGYPEGKGFRPFHYLFKSGKIDQQIGVELQAMWAKELGIRMELRQIEAKIFWAAQSALDYDLSRSSWIGDYADPNTFLDLFMSQNGNNRTGWKNARYDDLIREANSQTDAVRREKLLQEAETILVREALPIVPIYFYAGINFYDPEKIEGIYDNLLDEHPVQAIRRKR